MPNYDVPGMPRIEPIPCGEREWETEEGRPILDIARQEGQEISILSSE